MKKENKMQMRHQSVARARLTKACYVWSVILLVLLVLPGGTVRAQQSGPDSPKGGDSGQASLDEIGAKLTNPVSDVWALFTEFDFTFSDGDLNTGESKIGGRMIIQPVLPIPLYGKGENEWKLITRPVIPLIFSQPVPNGLNNFENLAGLGDIQLPMLVSPPSKDWILGLGPTFLIPTATQDAFGREQWGAGAAGVLGYKTKEWIGFVFPQYTWGIGGTSQNTPSASYLSLLYGYFYNLPNGWQVGTNPTITYDDNAPSGNKWNVPVGITVSKMTSIGGTPVKLQLGLEYSVVHQDAFGQVAQIKLNIIPVIPSLVANPIFGGN
ncbi:MAG TPA: hypothetical protein VFG28_15605 [Syntrophales bacterium]|nr:hypothetical protein [Syntrophales bacterium]